MIVRLLITFCLLTCTHCLAQREVLSHIPKNGKTIYEFIPTGFDTVAVAKGDLNKDGVEDAVMVLRDLREDTASADNNVGDTDRLLVIVFKTKIGWKLAAVSCNIVMCKRCGGVFGDPFNQITITSGVVEIDHYGGSNWRWAYNHKFRYQDGDFYLIGITKDSYSIFGGKGCDDVGSANRDFEDINLITGQRARLKITEDCKVLLDKKDKITTKPLVRLADYKYDN